MNNLIYFSKDGTNHSNPVPFKVSGQCSPVENPYIPDVNVQVQKCFINSKNYIIIIGLLY